MQQDSKKGQKKQNTLFYVIAVKQDFIDDFSIFQMTWFFPTFI